MLSFTLEELLSIPGSKLTGPTPESRTFTVATDTRNLPPGSVYIALRGERFDGHAFVRNAFNSGVELCVAQEDYLEKQLRRDDSKSIIKVDDTLSFYQELARFARRRQKAWVLGITGSSGKTTTKEMCAAVFGKRKCHKSAANENNEIGVPKTIFAMESDCEILILEMGMRGLGQIAELARIGEPQVGIITNVGMTHVELLGSQENIAAAKCELLEGLKKGPGIIGQMTDLVRSTATNCYKGELLDFESAGVKVISVNSTGTAFRVAGIDRDFFVHAHGEFLVRDAWCAIAAGRAYGLPVDEIAEGLAAWSHVPGRGNKVDAINGAIVVDESYNANPDSVKCAVDALLAPEFFSDRSKVVVLGKMAELGEFEAPLHKELGKWLKDKPISMLVTVGDTAALIAKNAEGAKFEVAACDDQDQAFSKLKDKLDSSVLVMVKGSHSTNLGDLVKRLAAK